MEYLTEKLQVPINYLLCDILNFLISTESGESLGVRILPQRFDPAEYGNGDINSSSSYLRRRGSAGLASTSWPVPENKFS